MTINTQKRAKINNLELQANKFEVILSNNSVLTKTALYTARADSLIPRSIWGWEDD